MENFLKDWDRDIRSLYEGKDNLLRAEDLQRTPNLEELRVDWNLEEYEDNPNSPYLSLELYPESDDDSDPVISRLTITHMDTRMSFPVESFLSIERKSDGLTLTYHTSIKNRRGKEEFYTSSTAFYDGNGELISITVKAKNSDYKEIGTQSVIIDALHQADRRIQSIASKIELEEIPGNHHIRVINKGPSVNVGLSMDRVDKLVERYNLIFPQVPKKISNLQEIVTKMRAVFDQFLALEKSTGSA